MTDYRTVNTQITLVTTNLSTWSDNVNKLDKIKAIGKHTNLLKNLTKFAGAMGAIGAAAGVIGAFLPSTESVILEQLTLIHKQLDSIEKKLSIGFKRVEDKLEKATGQIQIHDDMASLGGLHTTVSSIIELSAKKSLSETQEGELNGLRRDLISSQDIIKHFNNIYANVMETDYSQVSLTRALYVNEYGNLPEMVTWTESVVRCLMIGITAYGIAHEIAMEEEEGRAKDENDRKSRMVTINNLTHNQFDEKLKEIGTKLASWVHHCETDWKANSKRFINDKVVHGKSITDIKILRDELSKHWPWRGWFVTRYEGKRGWDNHGVISKGGTRQVFWQGFGHEDENLIVWSWPFPNHYTHHQIQKSEYRGWTGTFDKSERELGRVIAQHNKKYLCRDFIRSFEKMRKAQKATPKAIKAMERERAKFKPNSGAYKFYDRQVKFLNRLLNLRGQGFLRKGRYLCWVGNQLDHNWIIRTKGSSYIYKNAKYSYYRNGKIRYVIVWTDS